MEKELCKVPCIKYFEDSNFIFKYNNDDIILNSIKVAILNEDNCFDKYIPFDISVGAQELTIHHFHVATVSLHLKS